MNKFWKTIMFSLSMELVIACSSNADSNEIIGNWQCDVEYPNLTGLEYISFIDNSHVLVVDSLVYSMCENNLNISAKCSVSSSGTWSLTDNRLKINLPNLDIKIDPNSLVISSDIQNIKIDSLKSDYNNFKIEICNEIEREIKHQFQISLQDEICIGEIKDVSISNLNIENSGYQLSFNRIQ